MPTRWVLFFVCLAAASLSIGLWSAGLLPHPTPDVSPKGGGESAMLTYFSLATAIVSLLTAIVGLAKTMIEAKRVHENKAS